VILKRDLTLSAPPPSPDTHTLVMSYTDIPNCFCFLSHYMTNQAENESEKSIQNFEGYDCAIRVWIPEFLSRSNKENGLLNFNFNFYYHTLNCVLQ